MSFFSRGNKKSLHFAIVHWMIVTELRIMKKIKRKKLVVNRPLQYNLITTFLLSVLFALVIFSGGVVLYYWMMSSVGDNLFKEFIVIHKQIESEQVVINEEGREVTETVYASKVLPPVKRIHVVLPPLLINNLIIMIVISVLGIYSSHRIAGPAYRMIADIQRVLDGDVGARISLREKDTLKDLAKKINELLDAFEKASSNK